MSPGGIARAEPEAEESEETELLDPLQGGPRVRFEEVLENPDDIDLNFRWAQTQVSDGDLTGAAATLERILLIRPDLQQVRFFYGLVLFRLDSLEAAQRELEQLRAEVDSAESRELIDSYLNQIARRRRLTRYFSTLTLGGAYDSNRNASPAGREVLIGGTAFSLGTDNTREGDLSGMALIDVRMERDLPYQEGHQLTAGITHYRSEQDDLAQFDLTATSLDLGLSLQGEQVVWKPRAVSSLVELGGETYLRGFGFELGAERELSRTSKLYGQARTDVESFIDTDDVPTADERDGRRWQLVGGLDHIFSPTRRLDVNGHFTWKEASERYNEYLGTEATAAYTWVVLPGQLLIASVSVGRDAYKKADISIDTSRRKDLYVRARAIYGIPVDKILRRFTPDALADVLLTVSAEQYEAESNLPNYDYSNRRYGIGFTKRVDF